MIDRLLASIAPHPCFGCAKLGQPLCDNCKYNITSEPFSRCLSCLGPTRHQGICQEHSLPYSRAWVVGERAGILEHLIDAYKFGRAKAVHQTLSELFDLVLPQLPQGVIIVPIPTINTHVRQRGYDHTFLVSKELARKRNLTLEGSLGRRHSAKQLGASRSERLAQAKTAFQVKASIDTNATYLLVDDVYTTGATIRYAAKTLREAGARDVWVAVIGRQVSTGKL